MQRTDWYLRFVRKTAKKAGSTGRRWSRPFSPMATRSASRQAKIDDFTNAKWETGILAGDFGGANIISLYGGYSLNPICVPGGMGFTDFG